MRSERCVKWAHAHARTNIKTIEWLQKLEDCFCIVVLLLFILFHSLRLFALPFTFCHQFWANSSYFFFFFLFSASSLHSSKVNWVQFRVSLKCIYIFTIRGFNVMILCIMTAVNLASSLLFFSLVDFLPYFASKSPFFSFLISSTSGNFKRIKQNCWKQTQIWI